MIARSLLFVPGAGQVELLLDDSRAALLLADGSLQYLEAASLDELRRLSANKNAVGLDWHGERHAMARLYLALKPALERLAGRPEQGVVAR